jgi:hypothetical protein
MAMAGLEMLADIAAAESRARMIGIGVFAGIGSDIFIACGGRPIIHL